MEEIFECPTCGTKHQKRDDRLLCCCSHASVKEVVNAVYESYATYPKIVDVQMEDGKVQHYQLVKDSLLFLH